GLGVAAALPSVPQGGEVRGPDPQGHRAADGAVQHLRRLAQDHLLLHGFLEAYPHPASSARQPGSDKGDPTAGQDGGDTAAPRLAQPQRRAVDQGGGGAEGPHPGGLRQEEQRQRGLPDAVRGSRHHPWYGDRPAVAAAPADRRDREAGERAKPADGGDDEDDERARRRDHGHHHQPVRAADLQQQDRLEGE
ncbi:unnamed protein product, partial [Ectocarpus fasciculatus]